MTDVTLKVPEGRPLILILCTAVGTNEFVFMTGAQDWLVKINSAPQKD